MTIEPVVPVGQVIDPLRVAAGPAVGTPDFSGWFVNEIAAVNTRLVTSDRDAEALAAGEVQSLHEVMIRMEETRHSFQLLVQVRNKLLEAYQEVMRMQV